MRSSLRVGLWFVVLMAACGAARGGAQLQAVGDGGPGPVKAQHLTAELTTAASAVAPGGTVDAGLVLTLEERWHVYWVNAGDAGEPPHIGWTLPAGVTVTPMQFPIPTRLPLGTLMDFGYEEKAVFPFQVKVAKTVRPGTVHLAAMVTWIVCREVCVPGKAKLGIDLKVDPAAPASAVATVGALGEARSDLPKPLPAGETVTVTGGAKNFVVTYKGAMHPDDAEVYPFRDDLIANAPNQPIDETDDGIRVWVPRSADLKELPKEFHAVLRFNSDEAYEFTSPVVPGEIPVPDEGGGGAKPTAATAASGVTLWGALGLAFVGGAILNLMPCVFPVLFLKGLTLLQSSGEEKARLRAHGLVYTLGILVSFWAIVAVLLGLRSSTNQIGWGFQLQSPTFLAVLALGLFFFSLSLAGQFDLGLSMTSAGDRLTRKEGFAGSFFTGVLAVVVATPCTAPLMGAAIGFALAQPAVGALLIFTALALGLATPYLLLTLQPAWMRWLPRPGAWMETLKQLTAVPLFATVIWLVWVYGQLFSGGPGGAQVDHVAKLLIGFLLLAMAGWAMGRWPARRGSTIAAVLLGVCAVAVPLVQAKESSVAWQPYTQAALAQARAAGKPVFVDFTAAWCLSCQVNERVVLRSAEVQREFAQHGVALMRADWTQYDPAITAELGKVGRSGVPTYVLYPGAAAKAPDVLPELLSKPAVLEALQRDLK